VCARSNAGVSRSVSICIAYLLLSGHASTYDDAYAHVRAARPVARPNAGFVRHLRTLCPSRAYAPT
jgi:protein-tyrosine phosphatase